MEKDLTRKWTENAYQNACDEDVGINLSRKDKTVFKGCRQLPACRNEFVFKKKNKTMTRRKGNE